jgi:hypothetical protein
MESAKEPPTFTPALQAAEDDLRKHLNASCYLVISHNGYWGRGKDVEEAAKNCIKEGASRSHNASVLLIVGDTTAEVNSHGYIIRAAGSHNIRVISRVRLGALLPK